MKEGGKHQGLEAPSALRAAGPASLHLLLFPATPSQLGLQSISKQLPLLFSLLYLRRREMVSTHSQEFLTDVHDLQLAATSSVNRVHSQEAANQL